MIWIVPGGLVIWRNGRGELSVRVTRIKKFMYSVM